MLTNGHIVFSAAGTTPVAAARIALYRMQPDGTGLQLFYGTYSHATGTDGATVQFVHARVLPDASPVHGAPFTDSLYGGEIVTIDTPNYVENTQPDARRPGVLAGPAQITGDTERVSAPMRMPSAGGRYSAAFPLWDGTGRILVSWSHAACWRTARHGERRAVHGRRLADPAVDGAAAYGIWLYDPAQTRCCRCCNRKKA